MRTTVPLAMGLILSGCFAKTPYAPTGYRGGYNNFETQPGIHFVSFQGNGFTNRDEVIAGWHRRAAEICGGRSRYEVIDASADTKTFSTPGSYQATATTHGNTTYVHGTSSPGITYQKSRAEGYVRCVELPAEEIIAAGRWCFEGSHDGRAAGGCRNTLDECAAYAERLINSGLENSSTCQRTTEVVCVGATKVIDSTRVVECFASAGACDYFRGALESAQGWSEISGCGNPDATVITADGHAEAAAGRETSTGREASCQAGDATACLAVAYAHENAGDSKAALVFAGKACEAGEATACITVARAFEAGTGIEPNGKKASAFYKAACKLGNDEGCEGFARVRAASASETVDPPATPQP